MRILTHISWMDNQGSVNTLKQYANYFHVSTIEEGDRWA